MAVEGTTAFRFAEAINAFDGEDKWADEYGAFVANLHDNETALATALSPAARLQAYLALLPGSDTFFVLHGLHRWVIVPPSRSVNEGKLVAFEGETLGEDSREPPDLLRFDSEENELFKLLPLAKIDLAQVTKFYDGSFPYRDQKWFDEATFDEIEGVRLGRLIPIPTAWAALFLDYPNVGTALRQVQALISLVAIDKLENFKLLAYSMAHASFLLLDLQDSTSVLELNWKRLPHVKCNRMWRMDAWQSGERTASNTEFDEGKSSDEQKAPPEDIDPFFATFEGDWQPRILVPGVHNRQIPSWGSSPNGACAQSDLGHWPTHLNAMPSNRPTDKPTNARGSGARPGGGGQPTAQHNREWPHQGLNIGAFMATVLKAQTDNQLAIAAARHTNMVAFHTATAQASEMSGGKDARLTAAKTSILRACTGQVSANFFQTPQVYKEMESEGATSEAVAWILRCLLQPVRQLLHKSNILVTPHLVLTVKNLSFFSNGDKMHSGCTKGITVFAVPWKTQDAMNEEKEEELCYTLLTLKSVADVRKHVSAGKVELPATLSGLIWLFNNYCHLLEVLFGPNCPHLVHARGIRDTLDDNEADLETRITQQRSLHLLWRVHHNARQFFLVCKRWSSPAPAPKSSLASTVARLVDDCTIDMMLTCPEAKFLGGAAPAKSPNIVNIRDCAGHQAYYQHQHSSWMQTSSGCLQFCISNDVLGKPHQEGWNQVPLPQSGWPRRVHQFWPAVTVH